MPDKPTGRPIARPKIRLAPLPVPRPKIHLAGRPVPRPKHVLPRVEVAEAEAGPAQRDRPDGRLGPGLDATAVSAIAREGSIERGKKENTKPIRQRRSGSFGDTLNDAENSAKAKNAAIDQKRAIEARKAAIAREDARERREGIENIKWKSVGQTLYQRQAGVKGQRPHPRGCGQRCYIP